MADDELTDDVDDIEATMLVIEDTDGVLEIDDPSRRLTENERAGMLLRALLQELGVAWTFTPDDDD